MERQTEWKKYWSTYRQMVKPTDDIKKETLGKRDFGVDKRKEDKQM
jgi:hypothetical protein